jgi:hypothetical protein
MSIETTTTTTPGAPIPAPPAHWRPGSDRPSRRVPGAQLPERVDSAYPYRVPTDPDDARRFGEQVQGAHRRTAWDRRVAQILAAANCLAAVSAEKPDDEIGREAFRIVHDLRDLAGRLAVPAPSRIRHEVPGVAA